MGRAPLYLVVAIAGGCVLTIEILGTRLLGPFYGVSLFLWSALISVTLAALSLGYALGGRRADRDPHASGLALLLAAAGGWMLLVPLARTPILHMVEPLGLRASVLLASMALFFPPLTLLGMVSPYAIRLRAAQLEHVGRTAGDLYAISTVASVAAALLTGFWLIPNVGVTRLAAGTGIALLVAALIAFRASPRTAGGALALLMIVVTGVAGAWQITRPEAADGALRFVGQSPYAEIRVMDVNSLRYLLIDGGVHTIVRPRTPENYHPYVHVSELAKNLYPKSGTMLLVGLGGGATARAFAREGWQVEAVDIDPLVVRVAREYFDFKPVDAHVTVADGRRFLATDPRRWDLIFFDAFGSSSIPFHLVTAEAFALAHRRLAPGGVLMLNVEAVGWHDDLVRGLGATLHREFAHVVALPIAEPPIKLGNVIMMASDRPLEISDEALGNPADYLSDLYLHWGVVLRNHAWDNRYDPSDGAPAAVITDDLNPSDIWAERINRVARLELHQQFAKSPSW